MSYYSRNLPHWHPEGKAIFLTFRLWGSLPATVLQRLATLDEDPRRQFAAAERGLDAGSYGPRWLAVPEVADVVEGALVWGQNHLNFYLLEAYVVMPNHVHALLQPLVPLPRITRGIKGVSAKSANRILNRGGEHFWQDESFDHWIRNPAQFERIRTYIEMNPVKAGLVARPQDWRWSSAHK
jgi:REP element-mobilizing transposase RayT